MRLLPLFLLAGALALGCSSSGEPGDDSGGDALTQATGDLAGVAERTAESVAKQSSEVTALTTPNTLPSATFGRWSVGALATDDGHAGFLVVPATNAPPGAFAVVLADASSKIVATAAYVPDEVPNASDVAGQLLGALPADAASYANAPLKTQSLFGELVVGAIEVLVGLTRDDASVAILASAKRTEAHFAAKTASTTWKQFATLMENPRAMKQYLAGAEAVRAALDGRKIVMVEAAGAADGEGMAEWLALTPQKLDRYFASYPKENLALAIRGDSASLPVIRWALERDVPVVVSTTLSTPTTLDAARFIDKLLESSADAPAIDAILPLLKDPQKAALLRILPGAPASIWVADSTISLILNHLMFTPLFAVADEGLALSFRGRSTPFVPWLRRFAMSPTIRY